MRRFSFFILALLLGAGCQQAVVKEQTAAAVFQPEPGAPLDETKTLTTVAFGSCADPRKPEAFWPVIQKEKPDLFLATGDNVYASRPEDKPISKMYAIMLALPEYIPFHDSVPILATWDDHDYGQQDGGVDNPEKVEAKTLFLNVYGNDAKLIPSKQEGIYHSQIIGPIGKQVQILLLDTRWFRSSLEKNEQPKHDLDIYQPTKDKSKTLLGAEQWDWLRAELKKPADFRILVSSIQFLADEHGFEKWGNFPHERQKMLDLLNQLKIRNLVILSGDRHAGEISHLKDKNLDLIDITSSGLNRGSTLEKEPNRYRVGKRFTGNNFGLVAIDWKKKNAKIQLLSTEGVPLTSIQKKF